MSLEINCEAAARFDVNCVSLDIKTGHLLAFLNEMRMAIRVTLLSSLLRFHHAAQDSLVTLWIRSTFCKLSFLFFQLPFKRSDARCFRARVGVVTSKNLI